MAKSVFEAIQSGEWNYEPESVETQLFAPTDALPGTEEKIEVLCERIRLGLPLWHPSDRQFYDAEVLEEAFGD